MNSYLETPLAMIHSRKIDDNETVTQSTHMFFDTKNNTFTRKFRTEYYDSFDGELTVNEQYASGDWTQIDDNTLQLTGTQNKLDCNYKHSCDDSNESSLTTSPGTPFSMIYTKHELAQFTK